jgi:hypothetical protein
MRPEAHTLGTMFAVIFFLLKGACELKLRMVRRGVGWWEERRGKKQDGGEDG